ncbi:hypothetical protein HPB51_019448 [Rhipicephalus microplus]|uniref:Uncharacterized protein n=1 Tax=Rhipicephalus microplus TaxID=6941 RepID=A0A9J6DPD8_RHIMP|nr:hypothetical protein HPB51_019448 [Rhipicephalus microplus]
MSKPASNFTSIQGHKVKLKYRGMRRVTEGCEEACKRCGGRHGTRECFRRRLYLAAARGFPQVHDEPANDEQNGHPVTSRRAEQTTELQVLKPRSPAPCTSRTPNYWDNAAEHEWVDEHATLPEPEPLMGSGENSSESSHDGTDTEQAASSSPETSSVETSRDSWVVLLSEGEEQKVLDHENGEELAELLVAEAHFPPLDVGNASPRDTGITPRVGATMPSHLTRCSW